MVNGGSSHGHLIGGTHASTRRYPAVDGYSTGTYTVNSARYGSPTYTRMGARHEPPVFATTGVRYDSPTYKTAVQPSHYHSTSPDRVYSTSPSRTYDAMPMRQPQQKNAFRRSPFERGPGTLIAKKADGTIHVVCTCRGREGCVLSHFLHHPKMPLEMLVSNFLSPDCESLLSICGP